jgi:hypothetical protein
MRLRRARRRFRREDGGSGHLEGAAVDQVVAVMGGWGTGETYKTRPGVSVPAG